MAPELDLRVHLAWWASKAVALTVRRFGRGSFCCPACGFEGSFAPMISTTGTRRYAMCPSCRALERHRATSVVLRDHVAPRLGGRQLRVLHVAPDPLVGPLLRGVAATYETADIAAPGVDHRVDLTNLPFEDGSYDLVFASHVLEHIEDDHKAIAEVRRVLAAGGLAILPVPVIQEHTVEYPEPNSVELGHVRAVGLDYFERYRAAFSEVELYGSAGLPPEVQPWIFEDRSRWPNEKFPLRAASKGLFHSEWIPVCWV